VYDAVLDDSYERLFLVMELVGGVAHPSYIHPERPLPVSWAAAVAAQVATVLSYAYEVPVIHRDLTPGNILVARDGTVKVLDFGIAAILRSDVTKLTATGTPIGTYQCVAPEQVRGGRTSTQTDLYALGCNLHELLCESLLFTGGSEYVVMSQHVNAAPTPLRALRPDVPAALEDLVLHLLLKAPESRPADVQEVYERLRPFLPPPGQKPSPGEARWDGAPDPTGIFRNPYAPRARAGEGSRPTAEGPDVAAPGPVPVPEQLRAEIEQAYQHSDALLEEERYAQAAEVLGEADRSRRPRSRGGEQEGAGPAAAAGPDPAARRGLPGGGVQRGGGVAGRRLRQPRPGVAG
jgi:hypothetical protein